MTARAATLRAPRRRGRLLQPPQRVAVIVIAIAVTMGGAFAISYSLALGRPTPHHVPTGVVGESPMRPAFVRSLEAATDGGLDFRRYPSAAAAEQALSGQDIYAALVLSSERPRLLVASAADVGLARLLEQAAERTSHTRAGPLAVVDMHPLPAADPQGLVAFYVMLAATILGFLAMLQLHANASGLSLRDWLACIAALAAAGGLMLTLAADPLIGALRGPFPELWAALAAQVAVAALFCSTMITLLGRWAIVPTWGFLVLIGNAASGGANAPPLLPAFYHFVGRFLPNGATVEIVRNAVYFGDHQHIEPMIVQVLWLACTSTALILSVRLLRRSP